MRHVSTGDITPAYPSSSEPGWPGLVFTHRTSLTLWFIAMTAGVGLDVLYYGVKHLTLFWFDGPSPVDNTALGILFLALGCLFSGVCGTFAYRSARHPERPLGSIAATGAIAVFALIIAFTSLTAGGGGRGTGAAHAFDWWYFNPFTYLIALPVLRLATDPTAQKDKVRTLALVGAGVGYALPLVATVLL